MKGNKNRSKMNNPENRKAIRKIDEMKKMIL